MGRTKLIEGREREGGKGSERKQKREKRGIEGGKKKPEREETRKGRNKQQRKGVLPGLQGRMPRGSPPTYSPFPPPACPHLNSAALDGGKKRSQDFCPPPLLSFFHCTLSFHFISAFGASSAVYTALRANLLIHSAVNSRNTGFCPVHH